MTLLENYEKEHSLIMYTLQLQGNPEIYTVASDISSFLPILACAIRPVIYATNDSIIAREVTTRFIDNIILSTSNASKIEEMALASDHVLSMKLI